MCPCDTAETNLSSGYPVSELGLEHESKGLHWARQVGAW